MINNPIIFYTASVIIVLFALISVCFKDVIKSLLAAIIVFFAGALFFYVLGSEYNAIIQAAVYGLAVPVIIGVSIMFIGGKCRGLDAKSTSLADSEMGKCKRLDARTTSLADSEGGKCRGLDAKSTSLADSEGGKYEDRKKQTIPYLTLLCACIFVLAFVYLMLISLAISPDTFNIMDNSQINSFETIKAFATGIFVNYVWAFELVSLLLTIVVAGIGLIRGRAWK